MTKIIISYRDALSFRLSSRLYMLSVDAVTIITPAVFPVVIVPVSCSNSGIGIARTK